ncbi:MutS-related protein [Psychroflexus sp. ALD_RP9]|uniref:MutS-related protein n=1 Tax=Psychroflexus sp. ALD_RP9 TaxID=2777186 RepID=UPI001A8ED795|nr:DNA mismatch repair protein MutS [Psychroflexus sp. ALD_RP9]QSS96263.1 DNA mismatch repair protein MutS [Psychroflexus sp. ALD_RP9]
MNIYSTYINRHLKTRRNLNKKLLQSSLIRISVFLLTIASLIWFWGEAKFMVATLLFSVIAFVILVSRHQNIKHKKTIVKRLISINENELKALNGDVSMFKNGEIYKDDQHVFSADLDMFGDRSFFQFINRTATNEGERRLADLLLSNEYHKISEKQAAIKELAKKIEFRQQFTAEADAVQQEVSNHAIVDFFKNHKAFIPKLMQWLPNLFAILSVFVATAYFLDYLKLSQLGLWALIGLVITGVYVKKVSAFSSQINQIQTYFANQQNVVHLIENESFSAELLKRYQSNVVSEQQKVSDLIGQFNKLVDGFEQRNNMLLGVVLNAFLLWDLRYGFKLETWIKNHGHKVEQWLTSVSSFDAYHSLANFAYNHPHFTYPELTETGRIILKSKEAVHPLIPKNEAVTNSFELHDNHFWIVTGANMAGKSTFLRTVGLQIVMSNLGLPVSAKHAIYKPIPVITSMRTADSLQDESSYFYAELSRLKFIIDTIKDQAYFIILDEILKGTNSKDKAEGSQKFIQKLNQTSSVGIIATHDISLCDLAENHTNLFNYHFDAEILDDELNFDYQLKPGVCQNMNASFLMKKMAIT